MSKPAASSAPQASVIKADPNTLARIHRAGVVTGAPAGFVSEVEPNDTSATAQPLATTPIRVRGNVFRTPIATGDVDFYSFVAPANSRVYAATMTGDSPGSQDTIIDIIDLDGTTVLDSDDDDGTIGGLGSSVGGASLVTGGTYFVRVRPFSLTLTGTIRPYDLYVRVLSGAPTAEVEPNNNGQTPNPLPANGWVSGTVDPTADTDTFSLAVNAGDTIVAILDADPERDTPEWNPRLAIGIFNNFFLLADGSLGGADVSASEALFMTVRTTGTYVIYVDTAGAGAPTNTYHLSVSVIPAKTRTCTTYAGTGGPIADLTTTDFTLPITDSREAGYLKLALTATDAATADLDFSLLSPDGNEVVLFDDPATTAGAGAPQINTVLEDEAGIPAGLFGIHSGMQYQPESFARLAYFEGMQAQGNWILRVRDDLTANTGNLDAWSLTICDDPRPACVIPGPAETSVFTTDFETDDAGFTHSGTQDEWQRGLPAFAPITTAHSGTNAFKTDLVGTYNASSAQELLSPNLNLTSVTGRITLNWWHKFQFESASFDSYWVEVRQVGNPASARRVFQWTGGTMTRAVGSPAVTIQESAGWSHQRADISSFTGMNVEVVFHLDSDTSGQFAGVGVDDVSITSCATVAGQAISNMSATVTDGQTTYIPGEVLTYTIVATNGGPTQVIGGNVSDTFPAELTNVTWTCAPSAGSTCTASGSGNINDTVNLLSNGTATYTVTTTVSNTATGSIANTVTVAVPTGWIDPDTSNNSATDVDAPITAGPAALSVDAPGNGVFEPGETVEVKPSWTNTSSVAFALTGTLANHTGPAGGTYTIPDGAADYGTIAGGATAACTDCYSVSATAATRPVQHWDSTVDETVSPTNGTKTWTLHIGNSFGDVTTASGFYKFVETILHNGVTAGCGGTSYCPIDKTTREQMAVFVLVSKEGPGYNPPACITPPFTDVPITSGFCKFIQELANRGVVAGCGGGAYCPTDSTTREQMSVFVLRTLDPALNPPACVAGSEVFADVPSTSGFCKWIEELARRGVVTGCGGGNYCPTDPVSREQMSVFLAVTFGLTLYGL